MKDKNIGETILEKFFCKKSPSDLWKFCPNRMLWEAIEGKNALILPHTEIIRRCCDATEIYILPEPFYMITHGIEPPYKLLDKSLNPDCTVSTLYKSCSQDILFSETESLYILDGNFTWMIVLTTENTPSGEQLCVYMESD